MNIDNFLWHDGNITSLSYAIKKSGASIEIEGEFYSTLESSERSKFLISCSNVSRFNNVINVKEILDNFSAGSVSNGYYKENTLWVYLSDGVIEINAENINVSKH